METMFRSIGLALLLFVVLVTSTLAQQTGDNANNKPHEDLDALVWLQTSAEYEAIARQTFRLARMNMGDALVDPTWSASTEQLSLFAEKPAELAALPPAIIVDVDGTVLDNSSYQSDLIRNETAYSADSWKTFVNEEVSQPIPGAVEFVNACRSAGVTVLFVTNREHEVEAATRRNLIATGLMKETDPDVVFTKYEQEEWTSDKATRRAHLASKYRILLLMGDDFNDFVTIKKKPTSQERKDAAIEYAAWWGRKWMMLPNPNYGGWERSAYDWNDAAPRSAKLKLKRARMERDVSDQ